MVIFAGVDAGTKEYEIVTLKNGEFEALTFETKKIREDPGDFIETIKGIDAKALAGLSGYGLPIKRFSELSDEDVFLMTLNLERDARMGMRKIIAELRKWGSNFYTIPGVIHLPTVPEWRKFNRIDLGTYDKVCSVALAILELSEEIKPEEQKFLIAEIGHGFTSAIAVEGGKIVDALGGTSGFMGYSSIGSMDAELAYLLGSFPKSLLFRNGIRDFVSEKGGNETKILSEFVLKNLKALEASVGRVELCFLSGRFAREVEKCVSKFYETRILRGFCKGKQSAQGAAIIANAISGGEFRYIGEIMEIFKAGGSIFDHLSKEIRERIMARLRSLGLRIS